GQPASSTPLTASATAYGRPFNQRWPAWSESDPGHPCWRASSYTTRFAHCGRRSMNDDDLKYLRAVGVLLRRGYVISDESGVVARAADEVERLRAERDRLREALKALEEAARQVQCGEMDKQSIDVERRKARAALTSQET